MTSQLVALNGAQRPRHFTGPLHNGSAGQEAVELAASAGLLLDPWQCYVLEESLGERADGKWSAREVGLIVSRQNGKGSILEARELAGLFLLGERELIHTAHLFKTSSDHFLRIRTLIENTPDLMRKIAPRGIKVGNTDQSINLAKRFGGGRLRFIARAVNGSGRGLSAIDFLCLDEAYDIPPAARKSLLPTQLASTNPQTWYTSSVEDRGVNTEHLKRLVERGRAGTSATLAYFEWSAADDSSVPVDIDDPEARAAANPGLGIRLEHESLQALRDSDPEAFSTEHLSIWPLAGGAGESLFGVGKWEDCAVAPGSSRIGSGRCFGIAVTRDRSHGCIAVAGQSETLGRLHVEPVTHAAGVDWIVARAVELQAKWGALFVIDGGGPAKSLIPALTEAGVQLVVLDTSKLCDSFDLFYDAVQAQGIAQMGYPEVDAAIIGAARRTVGERTALARKVSTADISPIEAVELAAWGSMTGQVLDYDIDASVA